MTDLPEPTESQPFLLLTDFDATMTEHDFYRRALAHLPPEVGEFWERYERDEITHFEALHGIFSRLPGDEEQVMRIGRETQLDPRVGEAVEELRAAGWQTVVVSAGTDWYSRRLLGEQGLELPVISSPGTLTLTEGLRTERLPPESPFFSADVGVDKAAVVRMALERFERVAFAGDSHHDLPPAELVPAEYRFAKGWLADHFDDQQVPYRRFHRWSEVSQQLLSVGEPPNRA